MPRFLHFACGEMTKANTTKLFLFFDWEEVRHDSNENLQKKADIVTPLTDLSKIESESYDAVFSSHSLERLYPHEVGKALSELLRVLKKDGHLLITCADLLAACTLVAEDKLLEPAYESPAGKVSPLDILYGFRPAIAAGHTQFARHCGFTPKAMMGTLAQVGFASLWAARNPEMFTFAVLATKTEANEEKLKTLASSHFAS